MKNKVFRRFLRRKVSVVAAIILLTIILACIFGPMFITTDPLEQDILNAYQAPSSAHWFGTDNMGRDIFIRMLYGGRNSLSISFEGVILGTFIGVMLGVCAGYFGGLVDTLISRFLDILLAFPGLLLAIAVVAVLGNGMQNTVIAISIFSIPTVARMYAARCFLCAAMNIFRPAKSWVKVLPALSLPTSFPTRFRRSSSMSLCSWVPQF